MKQNLIPETKVLEELKKAIAETLRADASNIQPDNSLIKDLGAESLDFLDINYRLEQTFGIKMARHFILEHIEEMFGEGTAIDENGKLTAKALALLKVRYGDVMSDVAEGLDQDEVSALITVRSMTNTVMDILDTLPDKCSKEETAWVVENETRIKCSKCGEYAAFTNGDDLIRQWLTQVQEERKIF